MKNRLLLPFCAFLSILFVWELLGSQLPQLHFVLPPPSAIAKSCWECGPRLFFHAKVTLKEMLLGFFLALSIAFPLACTMLRWRGARSFLQPLFVCIQCLPMFALAPIMVLWFGWSFVAILIPTALMIFFPLTLNLYQGLRATPPELLEFFALNQATRWQTFVKLRLPWALPHLFAGFKISAAISGIGAVGGEWAGAQAGLGLLMLESRRNFDIEMTFAALFCLSILTSLLYGSVALIERVVLPRRLGHPAKMKKRRGFVLAATSILSLALLMPGCQFNSAKPTTKLLLDWLPNPNHVPLYVGIDQGFFEAEGIHLDIQKMPDNGGGLSYLTSNRVDLFISHMPSVIKAASRGADIQMIGVLIKEPLNAIVYAKDAEISDLSDLNQKRLGYCVGSTTAFVDYLLDSKEITPKERLNVSVDLVSSMASQRVDFVYGAFWNIEPLQIEALGRKTGAFRLAEFGVPNYYEMVVTANTNSPETDPEFVTHFQRALQKSLDYCRLHPEKAFAIYAEKAPDKRQKTLKWEKLSWERTYPILAGDQEFHPEVCMTFYEWLHERSFIASPIEPLRLLPAASLTREQMGEADQNIS